MREDLRARQRLILILSGVTAFGLLYLLSLVPSLADVVYGRALGPLLASILSLVTGVVPFSVAEIALILVVLWELGALARGISEISQGARAPGNAALGGLLRLGAHLGVVVALFYLLWGFHYARPPLEVRQGWNGRAATVDELARLAGEMVEATNFEYSSLHFAADHGMPTHQARENAELIADLEAGWRDVEPILGRPGILTFGFGRPKPVLSSRLLDYLGVSGFYFPWTGEANYNAGLPPATLPHALAHEMAHQRGFAREEEANFVGFLVAGSAVHSYERYAAFLFAQGQLLTAVARHDRELAAELASRRFAGVIRDLQAVRAYWDRFQGPAMDATRGMNDAYLRSQGVPDGIASYGRSVELLVAYARSRGGWLLRSPR